MKKENTLLWHTLSLILLKYFKKISIKKNFK